MEFVAFRCRTRLTGTYRVKPEGIMGDSLKVRLPRFFSQQSLFTRIASMTTHFIPKTFRHTVLAALTAAACIGFTFASNSFQVTAIVGKNMKSTLECWTLAPDYMDVRGVSPSCHLCLSRVRGATDHDPH